MTTHLVHSKGRKVGAVNINPNGFVIIDADDLREHLAGLKGLWDSTVTVTPYKNLLRVRLDIPFKDIAELEENVQTLLRTKGYEMVPAE